MYTLITGASGFIGSSVVENYIVKNIPIIRHSRIKILKRDGCKDLIKDLAINSDWGSELSSVSVIIHIASIAHAVKGVEQPSVDTYKQINCNASLRLAEQAARSGVKRFVFISTIGVNGIVSEQPFTEKSKLAPHNMYAQSKYEAEEGLRLIAKRSNMEVVIIRAPLVYGPNALGNIKKLTNWIKKRIPLPFGAVNNQRSFVALENLVSFICLCADRDKSCKAANQTFVISDDNDVSTTLFLKKIAKAYAVKHSLIPIPISLMTQVANLLGKPDRAKQLFGNLQVDCSKAKNLLGWKPVITMDEQLKKMADAER